MKRQLVVLSAKLIRSAATSPLKLSLLNWLLQRVIPFNAGHGISLASISDNQVEVNLPVRRANKNHLGGIHACAIAAAGEFSSGVLLLRGIDLSRYRLIMKDLHVSYLKQGRSRLRAVCELPQELSLSSLDQRLASGEVCEVTLRPKVYDSGQQLIAELQVVWQLKSFAQVG
ncbi:MAG: DUF4442 domain-containing protein [Bdellovibrionota bacterium]